jgi:hypothetical protein
VPGDYKGKLVAHLKDGQILKGFSRDFAPGQSEFHIVRRKSGVAASQAIRAEELKALFQVKTWGRKDRHLGSVGGFPEQGGTPPVDAGYVRTVAEFYDGEKIYGFTRDYDPSRPGFSLIPADPEDNNARIYVLNSSLVNIQLIRD